MAVRHLLEGCQGRVVTLDALDSQMDVEREYGRHE